MLGRLITQSTWTVSMVTNMQSRWRRHVNEWVNEWMQVSGLQHREQWAFDNDVNHFVLHSRLMWTCHTEAISFYLSSSTPLLQNTSSPVTWWIETQIKRSETLKVSKFDVLLCLMKFNMLKVQLCFLGFKHCFTSKSPFVPIVYMCLHVQPWQDECAD